MASGIDCGCSIRFTAAFVKPSITDLKCFNKEFFTYWNRRCTSIQTLFVRFWLGFPWWISASPLFNFSTLHKSTDVNILLNIICQSKKWMKDFFPLSLINMLVTIFRTHFGNNNQSSCKLLPLLLSHFYLYKTHQMCIRDRGRTDFLIFFILLFILFLFSDNF